MMAKRLIFSSLLFLSLVAAHSKVWAGIDEKNSTEIITRAFSRDIAFIKSFSENTPAQLGSSNPNNKNMEQVKGPSVMPSDGLIYQDEQFPKTGSKEKIHE